MVQVFNACCIRCHVAQDSVHLPCRKQALDCPQRVWVCNVSLWQEDSSFQWGNPHEVNSKDEASGGRRI